MNSADLQELFSLQGKVALVTGASGDIGRAIAEGLAAAGASVALSGRSAEKLALTQQSIDGAGGVAASFPSDLSSLDAVAPLVSAVVERFGTVDILVNCAGMNRRQPIQEVLPETYDLIMDTNLKSAYFLTQAVLPYMIDRGGGKVINIGSLTSSLGIATIGVYG